MRNMKCALNRIVLLVLALTLSSCATTGGIRQMYPGRSVPKDQAAILSGEMVLNGFGIPIGGVKIKQVDGMDVASWGTAANSLEVDPGGHSLSVSYDTGGCYFRESSKSDISLHLDAVAGHRYLVKANSSGFKWNPEIIDKGRISR